MPANFRAAPLGPLCRRWGRHAAHPDDLMGEVVTFEAGWSGRSSCGASRRLSGIFTGIRYADALDIHGAGGLRAARIDILCANASDVPGADYIGRPSGERWRRLCRHSELRAARLEVQLADASDVLRAAGREPSSAVSISIARTLSTPIVWTLLSPFTPPARTPIMRSARDEGGVAGRREAGRPLCNRELVFHAGG